MNKFLGNKRCSGWVICIGLLSVALIAGGCEPLRKKFIRQKKKDQRGLSETIPILEPIDYPEKIHSASEDYKQHYSLWQVWHREFLNSLDTASNVKQELYDLVQLIAQLQEMQKLLAPEKNSKLSILIARFQSLKEDVSQPGLFRNTTNIKLRAELLGKQIREEYRFNKVKDSLIK